MSVSESDSARCCQRGGRAALQPAGAAAGTGTTSDPLPRRAAMAAMATRSWSGS